MSIQHPAKLAALLVLTAGMAAAQSSRADETDGRAQTPSSAEAAAEAGAAASKAEAAGEAETPASKAAAKPGAPVSKAEADERRRDIDMRAQATLDKLFEERESARKLFDEAAGYAVFGVTKAGFVFVTGGAGTGVAVDKHTGKRTYMRMGTGGLGLGLGAQTYGLVILFQAEGQLERFVQGGWNASTAAQAAAGQEGVAATSSFVGGIAIFHLTKKGLMAQADLSGTRFWPIDDLN